MPFPAPRTQKSSRTRRQRQQSANPVDIPTLRSKKGALGDLGANRKEQHKVFASDPSGPKHLAKENIYSCIPARKARSEEKLIWILLIPPRQNLRASKSNKQQNASSQPLRVASWGGGLNEPKLKLNEPKFHKLDKIHLNLNDPKWASK